jgi:hypothetical protein
MNDFKGDVKFVIIALIMCVLVPFTLISSFVFSAKFYSIIFNIPCEICATLEKPAQGHPQDPPDAL